MPNKKFLKEFVIQLLQSRLPAHYYYHNYQHTLYVLDKVNEIGQHENCTKKEIDLLSAAALWHDAGFINIYNGHEEEGCKLAMQYLPDFGYSTSDIENICGMIMATKVPHNPKNKLEEIIADADLEYLGTENAAAKANELFKELHYINPSLTKKEWDKMQINFIEQHQYFTKYCKENKEPQKFIYLTRLINSNF
jgi:predicted metal-dependent HD superfamily phosphohydrolase